MAVQAPDAYTEPHTLRARGFRIQGETGFCPGPEKVAARCPPRPDPASVHLSAPWVRAKWPASWGQRGRLWDRLSCRCPPRKPGPERPRALGTPAGGWPEHRGLAAREGHRAPAPVPLLSTPAVLPWPGSWERSWNSTAQEEARSHSGGTFTGHGTDLEQPAVKPGGARGGHGAQGRSPPCSPTLGLC